MIHVFKLYVPMKRLYENSLRNNNIDTALEFSIVKSSPVLSSLSSQLLEIYNIEKYWCASILIARYE